MEEIKPLNLDERREEYFGLTESEEQDLKNEILTGKINEIVNWINKNGR